MALDTYAWYAKQGFESNVALGRRFYANTPKKRNALNAFKWNLVSNINAKHIGGREERNSRTCQIYWVDMFVFEDESALFIMTEKENGRTTVTAV